MQNVSSAVMQQRHEAPHALDDYPTPPWATRALLEAIRPDIEDRTAFDPAANRGHMVKPLREYFPHVMASDVFDYGAGFPVEDYLIGDNPHVDWIITNPPFRLAEDFAHKALKETREGVALFVRSAFAESIGRYERLFSDMPPSTILQFSERVVLHKGRLAPEGSTATAYCWMVWDKAILGETHFQWIPPCRKRLEREGDYL